MEKVLVLDFGGQYDQLIARRVREQKVYAEVVSYRKITVEKIKDRRYKGIIFTGGPHSVYAEGAPSFDPGILELGIPILGICYGCQLIAFLAGGEVAPAENASEYGKTEFAHNAGVLYKGVPKISVCWMSHTDCIRSLPEEYRVTGKTLNCPIASFDNDEKKNRKDHFHASYGCNGVYHEHFSFC